MKGKAVVLLLSLCCISCHRGPSGAAKASLSRAVIESTADDKLEELVLDEVRRCVGKDFDREHEIVAAMPPGFRYIHAVSLLDGEVNNGGFNQFFWNSSGEFATDALEGLKEIGATRHAALLQRAIRIHEQEKGEMEKYKKAGTLDAFSESYKHTKLNPLDDEYYKLKDNLSQLSIRYIRAHPESFQPQ